MENTVEKIVYTKEDLKILASCCSKELTAILEDIDYDPDQFEELMKGMKKDYNFLYSIPLEDLMLEVNNTKYEGYLYFRLKVAK